MSAVGTDVGAIAGHTTNDIVGTNDDAAMLIAEVVLFAFVAFLWLGFRKFSFADTIRGVVNVGEREAGSAGAAAAEAVGEVRFGGAGETVRQLSIEERCAELGAQHGLTERETEIFAMLAAAQRAVRHGTLRGVAQHGEEPCQTYLREVGCAFPAGVDRPGGARGGVVRGNAVLIVVHAASVVRRREEACTLFTGSW